MPRTPKLTINDRNVLIDYFVKLPEGFGAERRQVASVFLDGSLRRFERAKRAMADAGYPLTWVKVGNDYLWFLARNVHDPKVQLKQNMMQANTQLANMRRHIKAVLGACTGSPQDITSMMVMEQSLPIITQMIEQAMEAANRLTTPTPPSGSGVPAP